MLPIVWVKVPLQITEPTPDFLPDMRESLEGLEELIELPGMNDRTTPQTGSPKELAGLRREAGNEKLWSQLQALGSQCLCMIHTIYRDVS